MSQLLPPGPFQDPDERLFAEGEEARLESIEFPSPPAMDAESGFSSEEALSGDDLEQAYQRALEAVEYPEISVDEEELTPESEVPSDELSAGSEIESGNEVSTTDAEAVVELATPVEELLLEPEPAATIPLTAAPKAIAAQADKLEEARVNPTQVLEAVLFVGGPPLTAKKLAGVLRGSSDSESIERMIDELNQDYGAQSRPYEIRLGDGGYRLELRPEYERLRQRVYGAGPREVKLSQELLEVLALVAYKQPISAVEMEAVGKKNADSLLRQLLRRELIAIRRSEENPKEIRYYTTARFLSLFGLGSLEELPQPEDVDLK